jgi:ubiquinone/menaquinone biosynthesis C-methylase UbiE
VRGNEIVRRGYDVIARRYHDQRDRWSERPQLEQFASLLPEGANVLDVGCGAGVPVTRFLVEQGFEATGVDFSAEMLRLARANVPEAKFRELDMTALDFPDSSFDGLTAFYSIFHVPRERHADLFRSFQRLLKAGGAVLISLGASEWEGVEDDFFGSRMFWSHFSPEKSITLMQKAGFEIIWGRPVTDSGETHYWVLARNEP